MTRLRKSRALQQKLKSTSANDINNLDLGDNDGDGNPDSLGRPLFSRNLAVRR